jgi:hypothetical protein
MTKARKHANIVDASGNVVVPNAGTDATSTGIVTGAGKRFGNLQRTTQQVTIAASNCAGIIPTGNCSTAITNGYKDSTYNATTTYIDSTGATTNHIDLPKPPDGNWWLWASKGFTGVQTSNCANNGAYDGAGGNTSTLNAVDVTTSPYVYGSYGSTTDEIQGGYQSRSVQNCNCGSFNCRTNCNCNCACACDCQCN